MAHLHIYHDLNKSTRLIEVLVVDGTSHDPNKVNNTNEMNLFIMESEHVQHVWKLWQYITFFSEKVLIAEFAYNVLGNNIMPKLYCGKTMVIFTFSIKYCS